MVKKRSKEPSIDEMRIILKQEYTGEGWAYRVDHLMKKNQIIAIYAKIKDKHAKEREEKKDGKWVQMSLSDIYPELRSFNNVKG